MVIVWRLLLDQKQRCASIPLFLIVFFSNFVGIPQTQTLCALRIRISLEGFLEMDIRRIQWQETIPLRHKVLWPNQNPEYCYVEGDENAWHFGVFVHEALVSVASVYPDGEIIRLRKFATTTEHQGKGIGTALLQHILAELAKSNVEVFWCDARETAIGFYERFGMSTEGERFYKGPVPYFKMSVLLR